VEAGNWIFNLCYLISARKMGKPDPRSEVEVTMESGERIRLEGDEAANFLCRLEAMLPGREPPRSGPTAATSTKIIRGRDVKPG
jgi:hypothetical protein